MTRERGRGRVYRRPNSEPLWVEFWLRGKQIRKSTGTSDPKEAEKFLKAELDKVGAARIGARKYVNPKHGKFALFAVKFRNLVLSTKKYSTQVTEGSRLKRLVAALGTYQVRDLCPELVQEFLAGIHAKTARNYARLVGMMNNSAKAWNLSSCDWLEGVELPEYIKPESPFFTLDEMRRIIRAATGAFKTFVWLASETGMRLGELCALQVSALNLTTSTVVVRYSSWHGRQGSTKAKKPRTFRLSSKLVRRLAEQIAPVKNNPDAFVFRTSNGTAWNGDDVVKRWLKPLLVRLNIKTIEDGKDKEGNTKYRVAPRVGAHAFRHGNSTVMDSPEVNAPLKVRQDRVGHSDEEMTFHYTHASGPEHQAVAERLGELLAPPEDLEEMKPASQQAM